MSSVERALDGLSRGSDHPLPVIFGSDITALGVVRSLADNGIRCLCIDTNRYVAGASRYVHYIRCSDPISNREQTVREMSRLGTLLRSKGFRPVCFPTDDRWLEFLARNHNKLSEQFILSCPPWEIVEKTLDKAEFSRIVSELGIPAPRTAAVRLEDTDPVTFRSWMYPLIVKPACAKDEFLKRVSRKAVVIGAEEEWYELFLRLQGFSRTLIVQEFIPGDAKSLYTVSSVSSRAGKLLAASVGHKVLQYPPDAGTIVSGVTEHVPELVEYVRRLSEHIRMSGIANTEFKYDLRDGLYKVIETNMRPGVWNYSSTASGVNLSYICLMESAGLIGGSAETIMGMTDVFWTNRMKELLYYIRYGPLRNRSHYIGKRIKVDAVWNPKDPMPFLALIWGYVRKVISRPYEATGWIEQPKRR